MAECDDNIRSVGFLVEVSPEVGYGHLSRCTALFRRLPKGVHGFFVASGTVPAGSEARELGVEIYDHAHDAPSPDLLIHDRYRPDLEALAAARRRGVKRVVALDYFGDDDEGMDLVISLFEHRRGRPTRSRAPRRSGLEYAIIHPRFDGFRVEKRRASESVVRIVVMFGGSDPSGHTIRTLRGLDDTDGTSMAIDVVVGPVNPAVDEIQSAAATSRHRTTVHVNPNDLPAVMSRADLAICGPSTTFFEFSYLGVPALVMAHNSREQALVDHLTSVGLAIPVRDDLPAALLDAAAPTRRQALVDRQQSVFDGRGAHRILAESGVTELTEARRQ